MRGEADRQRELLDVESVAGHLLEPGSVLALLAEHRVRLFPSELFIVNGERNLTPGAAGEFFGGFQAASQRSGSAGGQRH